MSTLEWHKTSLYRDGGWVATPPLSVRDERAPILQSPDGLPLGDVPPLDDGQWAVTHPWVVIHHGAACSGLPYRDVHPTYCTGSEQRPGLGTMPNLARLPDLPLFPSSGTNWPTQLGSSKTLMAPLLRSPGSTQPTAAGQLHPASPRYPDKAAEFWAYQTVVIRAA